MKRKLSVLFLFLAFSIGVGYLTGCRSNDIKKNVPDSAFQSLKYFETSWVELPLDAEEFLLDVTETSDGMLSLLTGIPYWGTDPNRYFAYSEGDWVICDKASEYGGMPTFINSYTQTVSFDWQNISSKHDAGYDRLIELLDGVTYRYVSKPVVVEMPYSQMQEGLSGGYKVLLGSDYAIYREDQLLFEIPATTFTENFGYTAFFSDESLPIYKEYRDKFVSLDVSGYDYGNGKSQANLRPCQFVLKNNMVFLVTEKTGTNGYFLFINDKPVEIKNGQAMGLFQFDEQIYAVINRTEREESLLGTGSTVVRSYLVLIDENTTCIDDSEGYSLEVAPDYLCATAGNVGYFFQGTCLYATDGREVKNIANLEMAGVKSNKGIRRICPLSDGRILIVINGKLLELSPSQDEYVSTLETLVLGYDGWIDPNLKKRIDRFNEAAYNAVVELESFSNREKLNLAILSGDVDIILSSDLVWLQEYANQDILVELSEVCPLLFENEALFGPVLEASKYKGETYFLPREFTLYGYQWTLGQENIPEEDLLLLLNYVSQMDSLGMKRSTREDMFEFMALRNLSEWVDFEKGICDFDNERFYAILEFSKACASDSTEAEANQFNEQYFDVHTLNNYVDMTAVENDTDYFPLPLMRSDGYAMLSTGFLGCVYKEEMQSTLSDFFTYIFLEDIVITSLPNAMESGYGFSVNCRELYSMMTPVYPEGATNERKRQIDQQVSATWEILEASDHFHYTKNKLSDVMMEEASRYFSGQITAKQAAEYIQNRVSIYLAEQG